MNDEMNGSTIPPATSPRRDTARTLIALTKQLVRKGWSRDGILGRLIQANPLDYRAAVPDSFLNKIVDRFVPPDPQVFDDEEEEEEQAYFRDQVKKAEESEGRGQEKYAFSKIHNNYWKVEWGIPADFHHVWGCLLHYASPRWNPDHIVEGVSLQRIGRTLGLDARVVSAAVHYLEKIDVISITQMGGAKHGSQRLTHVYRVPNVSGLDLEAVRKKIAWVKRVHPEWLVSRPDAHRHSEMHRCRPKPRSRRRHPLRRRAA
jgi:hypothetical protein